MRLIALFWAFRIVARAERSTKKVFPEMFQETLRKIREL
jgi:hypothetical protein